MADESKYPTRIAPYGLRMPDDLKARVQAAADAANRSMNAEIVATLEEKYPAPASGIRESIKQVLIFLALVQPNEREYLLRGIEPVLNRFAQHVGKDEAVISAAELAGLLNRFEREVGHPLTIDDVEKLWHEAGL